MRRIRNNTSSFAPVAPSSFRRRYGESGVSEVDTNATSSLNDRSSTTTAEDDGDGRSRLSPETVQDESYEEEDEWHRWQQVDMRVWNDGIARMKFFAIIKILASTFSFLMFSVLICWVLLTTGFLSSFHEECDVPLKIYYMLTTFQLILDIFRADILRVAFQYDLTCTHYRPVPYSVIAYNIFYIAYAMLLLQTGLRSTFLSTSTSTCAETAPDLFVASKIFVTLSIGTWTTIFVGYLLPFALVISLYRFQNTGNRSGRTLTSVFFRAAASVAAAMTASIDGNKKHTHQCENTDSESPLIPNLRLVAPKEFQKKNYPKECCICLTPFDLNEGALIVATNCGHIYHETCCQEWLQVSKTCPICRTAVGKKKTRRVRGRNGDAEDTFSVEELWREVIRYSLV